MKANPDNCHFLSSLDMNTEISVSSLGIKNAYSQKLLGVTVDFKLNFHDHVSNLCKKVSAKVGALARVSPLMLLNQRKLIMKVILMYQLGYCPLVLINYNRALNN